MTNVFPHRYDLYGSRTIAPNSETNPNSHSNRNPNWGVTFLGGNCPDTDLYKKRKKYDVLMLLNNSIFRECKDTFLSGQKLSKQNFQKTQYL